jgi:hypothetical protein
MTGLTDEARAASLPPLREKVSAKPTDEEFQRGALVGGQSETWALTPLIRPASRATFSRKGRRMLFLGLR